MNAVLVTFPSHDVPTRKGRLLLFLTASVFSLVTMTTASCDKTNVEIQAVQDGGSSARAESGDTLIIATAHNDDIVFHKGYRSKKFGRG